MLPPMPPMRGTSSVVNILDDWKLGDKLSTELILLKRRCMIMVITAEHGVSQIR